MYSCIISSSRAPPFTSHASSRHRCFWSPSHMNIGVPFVVPATSSLPLVSALPLLLWPNAAAALPCRVVLVQGVDKWRMPSSMGYVRYGRERKMAKLPGADRSSSFDVALRRRRPAVALWIESQQARMGSSFRRHGQSVFPRHRH